MNSLLVAPRADIPEAPLPPGEGRTVSNDPVAMSGQPTLGPEPTAPSFLAGRPARMQRNEYTRDQSGGQSWINDGGHVAVGRHQPYSDGEQEAFTAPQRPTFRVPPERWYEDVVDAGGA